MSFIRIDMMDAATATITAIVVIVETMGITGMMGAGKNRHRASRSRFFTHSRRLGGRNEETWEGARYVRPPVWTKNVLRKRYLI